MLQLSTFPLDGRKNGVKSRMASSKSRGTLNSFIAYPRVVRETNSSPLFSRNLIFSQFLSNAPVTWVIVEKGETFFSKYNIFLLP